MSKRKHLATVHSDDNKVDIHNCARCGLDHEVLIYYRFTNQPKYGKIKTEGFAFCPENGQPILVDAP